MGGQMAPRPPKSNPEHCYYYYCYYFQTVIVITVKPPYSDTWIIPEHLYNLTQKFELIVGLH